MRLLGFILVLAAASPAWAQFELYLVNGNVELPIGRAYDLGPVEPGASLAVPFRIRNISTAAATLDLLTANGAGFSLASKPALPLTVGPQKTVDFTVAFQSSGTGSYSASLDSVGISTILTAEVPVELTAQLLTAAGPISLAATPVNFGLVQLGASAVAHVQLLNQTSAVLMMPVPTVQGAGFSLVGTPPGGASLQPAASAAFDVQFSPIGPGAASGELSIGDRNYTLMGTGAAASLPQPHVVVSLPQTASAQQGTIVVSFDDPSPAAGAGTVTLTFIPAVPLALDSGIAFAGGGQVAAFTVSVGDTQGAFGIARSVAFQTGTTAGTLTVTVQLGAASDQTSLTIAPAVVGITSAQGVRSAGALEVDLTGFDNTRTAGAVSFTFFDASSKTIGASIQADGGSAFSSYFQNAANGTFVLKAIFPVVGDSSQIQALQATITNSAGSTTSAKTSF